MLINGVYFGIGLVALYLGAEWLVKGAAGLAQRLGLTPLVVGLTVVAFGSSAPELLVGVVASAQGRTDLVLGNVVGSNILNIALILGVAALVKPMQVGMRLLSREAPLMAGVSVLVAGMMLDGLVGRFDGVALVLGFVLFLVFVMRAARLEPAEIAREYGHSVVVEEVESAGRSLPWQVGLVLVGLVGLVVGAQLLVTSAVFFARMAGVSEVVIGLTVVAIGTSLPELATCVVAAFHGKPDIALGNAVGSNIFNLLSILGVAALIRPLPVSRELFELEIPTMIVFALLLLPLAWRGRVLGRSAGAVLILGYLAFTTVLVLRSVS